METDFQQIVDAHHGILYKIARAYTRERADFDDLYQEMLIQLWQSLSGFRGKSKLSTWVYRVALNTAITFAKKQKRQPLRMVDTTQQSLADHPFEQAAHAAEQQQQLEHLYAAIHQLNADERAIILLHLEEKQYNEIADIMGITTNLVGVKILRIKKKLRQLLQVHFSNTPQKS